MANNSRYQTRFKDTLGRIPDAIEWAEKQQVDGLSKFFMTSSNIPMYCFSSGGSLSTLHYASLLYETCNGVAKALSPLMMASISDDTLKNSKILVLSSSGDNPDVRYMVERLIDIKPKGLGILTKENNKNGNYLVKKLKPITSNWFMYNWLSAPGFISSISPFCNFSLIYKAFTGDSDIASKLSIDTTSEICYSYGPRVEGEVPSLDQIKNYIVLYSGWSEPVARDFESKMIESGIASVQLCDYRNYCHGRFIFLSNHMEDSALICLVTPREKEFAKNLIFEGKTFRGNRDLFPKDTPIAKIETEHDSPIASIDLLIKTSVFFSDVADANNIEPCSPPNPVDINKEVPRSMVYKGLFDMGPLKSSINGTSGSLNGVSRSNIIDYNPSKSIEENAKANEVSPAAIRKFIKDKRIDRRCESRMVAYNKVKNEYMKDSEQTADMIAQKLNMAINTVKQYLLMDSFPYEPQIGKVCLVVENKDWLKQREIIEFMRDKFPVVKEAQNKFSELEAEFLLKKVGLTNDKKGQNIKMIKSFMNMEVFSYKFKNKEIVF